MEEVWKEVEGFEGYYEVSNLGRLRSMDRIVKFKDGREHFYKSRMIQGTVNSDGYINIKLCSDIQIRTTSPRFRIEDLQRRDVQGGT